MRWPWSSPPPPAAPPDRRAEDKILEVMTWLAGLRGVGRVRVSIEEIQAKIDPGFRMHDRPDPAADPLTGCLPVTAPGGQQQP